MLALDPFAPDPKKTIPIAPRNFAATPGRRWHRRESVSKPARLPNRPHMEPMHAAQLWLWPQFPGAPLPRFCALLAVSRLECALPPPRLPSRRYPALSQSPHPTSLAATQSPPAFAALLRLASSPPALPFEWTQCAP